MTTTTASDLSPPTKPPRVAIGFAGDEIEEIGDRLAQLTLKDAVKLVEYLTQEDGSL